MADEIKYVGETLAKIFKQKIDGNTFVKAVKTSADLAALDVSSLNIGSNVMVLSDADTGTSNVYKLDSMNADHTGNWSLYGTVGSESWKAWSEAHNSSGVATDVYIGQNNTSDDYNGSYNTYVCHSTFGGEDTRDELNEALSEQLTVIYSVLDRTGTKYINNPSDPLCRYILLYVVDEESGEAEVEYAYLILKDDSDDAAEDDYLMCVYTDAYPCKKTIADDGSTVLVLEEGEYKYVISDTILTIYVNGELGYECFNETIPYEYKTIMTKTRPDSYQFGIGNKTTNLESYEEDEKDIALNIGNNNLVKGNGINIGVSNEAGNYGVNIGFSNKSNNDLSILIGSNNTAPNVDDSSYSALAIGKSNTIGLGTIALGANNTATGNFDAALIAGFGNTYTNNRDSMAYYTSTSTRTLEAGYTQSYYIRYIYKLTVLGFNTDEIPNMTRIDGYPYTPNNYRVYISKYSSYAIISITAMYDYALPYLKCVFTTNANTTHTVYLSSNSYAPTTYTANTYVYNTSVSSVTTVKFYAAYNAPQATSSNVGDGEYFYDKKTSELYVSSINTSERFIKADIRQPYDKTMSALIGYQNSGYLFNSLAFGYKNVVGVNSSNWADYADALYNDGFAIAIGRECQAARNYDMAIGYKSSAFGGENIATGSSIITGFNNLAMDKSQIIGGACNIALMRSYMNLKHPLPDLSSSISSQKYLPSLNLLVHSTLLEKGTITTNTAPSSNNHIINSYVTQYNMRDSENYNNNRSNTLYFNQIHEFSFDMSSTTDYNNTISHSILNVCRNSENIRMPIIDTNISHSSMFDIDLGSMSTKYGFQKCSITESDISHVQILSRNIANVNMSVSYFGYHSTLDTSLIAGSGNMAIVNNSFMLDQTNIKLHRDETISHNVLINAAIDGYSGSSQAHNFIFGGYAKGISGCVAFTENDFNDPGYNTGLVDCKSVFLFGDNKITNSNASAVFGVSNTMYNCDRAFIFGGGNTLASAIGNGSAFIYGSGNIVNRTSQNIVFGNSNKVGTNTTLDMTMSIIGGTENTISATTNSLILGCRNTTLDASTPPVSNGMLVVGNENKYNGSESLLFGSKNYVVTHHSLVFGVNNTTANSLSYATSEDTVIGNNSVAVNGSNILCVGNGIVAEGHNSVAVGLQLKSNQFQSVFGKYNKSLTGTNRYNTNEKTDSQRALVDTTTGALLVVGNGFAEYDHETSGKYEANSWTDEDYIHRSNAMVVWANGEVEASDFILKVDGKKYRLSDVLKATGVDFSTITEIHNEND